MRIGRAHLILAVLAPWLIAPRVAAAQVEASAEVQAALDRQKERSQRRERGLDAFHEELRPLADSGDPVAQFLIGTMLVGRDPVTAIPYLTRSAEHGCAGAHTLRSITLRANRSIRCATIPQDRGRIGTAETAQQGDR